MISLHEEYIVDEHGKRKAVVVPIADWERILEALEEIEDVKAYDTAKAYPSDAVPLSQAAMELREDATE